MLQRLPSSRFGLLNVYRVYYVHAFVPNLHQICTKHEEGEATHITQTLVIFPPQVIDLFRVCEIQKKFIVFATYIQGLTR